MLPQTTYISLATNFVVNDRVYLCIILYHSLDIPSAFAVVLSTVVISTVVIAEDEKIDDGVDG